MSGIYWSEGSARVKDYSALTRNGKTVVTIKLEVTDPYDLSHILRNLDETQRAATPPPPAKTRAKKPNLRLAAPLLQIAHHRGDGE